MRTLILLSGGVLLGWQFGELLASGDWSNIPVSILIPFNVQVQHWLYRLNPTNGWGDFLTTAFAAPVWLLLLAAFGWFSRENPRVRPASGFFTVRAAARNYPVAD